MLNAGCLKHMLLLNKLLVLRMIMSVQELVGLVSKRLMQELFVQGIYFRVLVGFPQRQLCILNIDAADALSPLLVRLGQRLSAAAYTTTGAGHDFNEVIRGFPGSHLIHQLASAAQAVSHSDPDLRSIKIDLGFFDPIHTTDRSEVNILQGFLGNDLIYRPQSCFHHSSGSPEDYGSTVYLPIQESKLEGCSLVKSSPAIVKSLPTSRVVKTRSTSR